MTLRSLAATLLLLSASLVLLPAANACHAGHFETGPRTDTEVVGVGSTGIGVYVIHLAWQEDASQGSAGCEGASWVDRCPTRPVATETLTTVGPVIVPQVRVLGQEVVPETFLLGPVAVPVASENQPCVTVPFWVGVYVTNVIEVGTDDVLP